MAEYAAPRKIIPTLAWYRPFEPFAFAVLRFCLGALLIPHGVVRLFYGGFNADLGRFLSGAPAAMGALELVGGFLLAVGLFTRPAALLLAAEWIAIAVAAPVKNGASWLLLSATPHYPAFVAGLCFAFVLGGGGYYSLDRLLGKEL